MASSGDDYEPSDDEEWIPESEEPSDGESVRSSSESSDDEGTVTVDLVGTSDDGVRRLISDDPCKTKCLEGKEAALTNFLSSLERQTKNERIVSVMTSITMLMQVETVARYRGKGERAKFHFYLPLVGKVCREAFCSAYKISPRTLMRCKKRVEDGSFGPADHGNTGNAHHKAVDVAWLITWFREFAETVGQQITVRERTKERRDGRLVRYTTQTDYILLPAYFTWARLHAEMKLSVEKSGIRRFEPAESTMRKILTKRCLDIRITSPRSNVCDICVIYHNNLKKDRSADTAEEQAKHVMCARAMRVEYSQDVAVASDDHLVLVMDYAQNLTLPNMANTPSQFYFMSLISVSLFGVYCANAEQHNHYLYNERKGGKRSNEVISMLHRFLRGEVDRPRKRRTVYADNCGGQNKNNFVIKYLILLAHVGLFEEVNYKFFIKGHTKNACDRGFGHVKKKFVRSNCYTMRDIETTVAGAAKSSVAVNLEDEEAPFFDFKPVVSELYKNVKGLQKFQIFKASSTRPGTLECLESPTSTPVVFHLSRKYDNVLVTQERAVQLLDEVTPLSPPPRNPEKISDVYNNVRPYIPAEYRDDEMYAAPSKEQEDASREKKRARVKKKQSTQEPSTP